MWVYAQCLLVCILNNVRIVPLAGVDDHDPSRRLNGGRHHGGPGTDEERVLGPGGWGTGAKPSSRPWVCGPRNLPD